MVASSDFWTLRTHLLVNFYKVNNYFLKKTKIFLWLQDLELKENDEAHTITERQQN